MGAADPADGGQGDQAAGGAEEEAGEGPSGSCVGYPFLNKRTVAIVEDDDGKSYCDQEGGADEFGKVDI